MTTQLIRLNDGTLVEIEIAGGQPEQISGSAAVKVEGSVQQIRPTLVKVCSAIQEAWKELNKDMLIERAEVELGLSFEGEGNIYITKAKAGANLTVRLILKPSE